MYPKIYSANFFFTLILKWFLVFINFKVWPRRMPRKLNIFAQPYFLSIPLGREVLIGIIRVCFSFAVIIQYNFVTWLSLYLICCMHLPSYCILFKLNIFNDSRTFLSMGVTPIICLLFQNIGYSLSFVNINNTRKKSSFFRLFPSCRFP